jgi:hypothetical protein
MSSAFRVCKSGQKGFPKASGPPCNKGTNALRPPRLTSRVGPCEGPHGSQEGTAPILRVDTALKLYGADPRNATPWPPCKGS